MQMMPRMLISDYNYELSWALVSRAFGQWETPTGYQKKGGGKSLSPLPVGCRGLSVPWMMTTASWSGAPSLNSYNSLLLVHYDVFSIAWHVIPKHLQPTLWFYFYMKWKENIESFGYEILGINICFFFCMNYNTSCPSHHELECCNNYMITTEIKQKPMLSGFYRK